MAENRFRAGIIGVGFIGGADQVSGDALGQQVSNLDGTHFQALSNHGQIDLTAGSSRDAGRRERFAQRSGAKTYADWREMIQSEQLDIVSIATYAPQHAEMTIACAERGIRAIYCEKPIATYLSDAQKMVEACRQSGSLLVINHNRRFNPQFRRLRDCLAEGQIGDLISANLQWPSGRLGNVGTHFIDALRMITGRQVEAVSAILDLSGKPDCRGEQFHDPGGWGLIRMEGGLIATIDAADYLTVPPSITINGSAGRALVAGSTITIEYPDGRRDEWPSASDSGSSMDTAVAEIVAWLDRGEPFLYSAEEALKTHEAIVAFHVSHAHNSALVTLPLTGTDCKIELQCG